MSTNYYECHVTMEGEPAGIKPLVLALNWKFSAIHGDSVFGDTIKCYATRHFNIKIGDDAVLIVLNDTANQLIAGGVRVIRRKVERVIFDDRSSKVQCDGGCVECHLDDLVTA